MAFKTIDELNASLDHIRGAPKDQGVISTLCYRPGFRKRVFADQISLSVADGVQGDRWKEYAWLKLEDGSPDPRIQVCILSKRVLDCIWRDGDGVDYPGDTMIVDMDLSEANLPTGSHLQAGSAVLEVSDVFNDACTKWSARYGKESRQWINLPDNVPLRLRGVLCRIVTGGEVKLGDRLQKV